MFTKYSKTETTVNKGWRVKDFFFLLKIILIQNNVSTPDNCKTDNKWFGFSVVYLTCHYFNGTTSSSEYILESKIITVIAHICSQGQ